MRATRHVNEEQLALYFGIGKYISDNTRKNRWGTSAIENISKQLSIELPGLKGFSATNLKLMRLFYESWNSLFNSSAMAGEIAEKVEYVLQDYQKPMGVATYKIREHLKELLPDENKLKELL